MNVSVFPLLVPVAITQLPPWFNFSLLPTDEHKVFLVEWLI
jgi:hypothetical protein